MSTILPVEAWAAALASLERMTPRRLSMLIDVLGAPTAFAVAAGNEPPPRVLAHLFDTPGLAAAWRASARQHPPAVVWERCLAASIDVVVRGQPRYPPALVHDPHPAPVLFVRGRLPAGSGRRVGIVGTRNATAAGLATAAELGRGLSAAGVHVLSGLARGIDGAAHRGALAAEPGAAPVAVVAAGLDVVYPPEHGRLWDAIAERGALISEAPPGAPPEPYRFPLRNRILAALSEAIVVVESRQRGGSLITVDEARRRDIAVMAVPGSVRSPAAAGVNALIRDGCPLVTDVDDVLVALGLDSRRHRGGGYDARSELDAADRAVLDLCGEPHTLEELIVLSRRSLVECAMTVARLESAGWLHDVNGWFQQSSPADRAVPEARP